MSASLLKSGWHVRDDYLSELPPGINTEKHLLNEDMKQFGKAIDSLQSISRVQELNGPMIIQVQRAKNISVCRDDQLNVERDRLLKYTVTDGHQTFSAIEMGALKGISLATKPGYKIQLTNKIPIENGMLVLSNGNTRFLGGIVKRLVDTWEIEKLGLIKAASRAPPFVPFGQKVDVSAKNVNFKSLDTTRPETTTISEDTEFAQQRSAKLKNLDEQIKQQVEPRQVEAQSPLMLPNISQLTITDEPRRRGGGRGRGRGRGGRRGGGGRGRGRGRGYGSDDDDDYGDGYQQETRPSTSFSLSSFVKK